MTYAILTRDPSARNGTFALYAEAQTLVDAMRRAELPVRRGSFAIVVRGGRVVGAVALSDEDVRAPMWFVLDGRMLATAAHSASEDAILNHLTERMDRATT